MAEIGYFLGKFCYISCFKMFIFGLGHGVPIKPSTVNVTQDMDNFGTPTIKFTYPTVLNRQLKCVDVTYLQGKVNKFGKESRMDLHG